MTVTENLEALHTDVRHYQLFQLSDDQVGIMIVTRLQAIDPRIQITHVPPIVSVWKANGLHGTLNLKSL
jgi:hypothetical protein